MTQEVEDAFVEYEDLKIKEKEIKVRLDELKPVLLSNLSEEQEVQGRSGTFLKKKGKVSWIYSQSTQEIMERLEETKKEEQRIGMAKEKYGEPFIEYRSA